MFNYSDTIYKNIGVTVSIAFLIYILISVIQIQFDVGSRITTYGSKIIKEGFVEGLTTGMTGGDNKMGGNGKDTAKYNDKGGKGIDKKLRNLIDYCVDNTTKNYKDAGMTIENDKDGKLDPGTVKLVIDLLKSKTNELMSDSIKSFVDGDGGIDHSISSDLNNTVTLITAMIYTLEKMK